MPHKGAGVLRRSHSSSCGSWTNYTPLRSAMKMYPRLTKLLTSWPIPDTYTFTAPDISRSAAAADWILQPALVIDVLCGVCKCKPTPGKPSSYDIDPTERWYATPPRRSNKTYTTPRSCISYTNVSALKDIAHELAIAHLSEIHIYIYIYVYSSSGGLVKIKLLLTTFPRSNFLSCVNLTYSSRCNISTLLLALGHVEQIRLAPERGRFGGGSRAGESSPPCSVGLARAHPLTKIEAMRPSRRN